MKKLSMFFNNKISKNIAIFILIFFICSCKLREKINIEEIVPTRTGAGIKLTRFAGVESVYVFEGNYPVACRKIDEKVRSFIVDFNWEKGKIYTFNVNIEDDVLIRKSTAFDMPKPFVLGDDFLGKPSGEVEVAEINKWSKKLYEEVDISVQNYIAVAGFDQYIRVYDKRGDLIWRHKIPAGVARCVKFSPAGDRLFAGEASPDGNIYCFCAETGKLCWRYAASKDIGTSSETYYGYQPKICSIAIAGGTVYVSAARSFDDYVTIGGKKAKYWPKKGIVYAFDLKTGKLFWKFPSVESMDTAPLKLSVDAFGGYLVFGGWGGSANGRIRQRYPENSLYVLDATSGALVWKYSAFPVKKCGFGSVSIGSNCHISQNGKYLACCSSDGRFFLFDLVKSIGKKTLHLIYEKTISAPLLVGRIPIYAYGGKVFVDNKGGVLLTVGRTYIAPAGNGKAQAPDVKHPRENSIIKLDSSGKICWVWQARGAIETPSLSRDSRFLVVAMCHNYITESKDMAGVYCFDLMRTGGGSDKLLWFYKMGGIGIACGISPDGKYIGAIEGPVDMDLRAEYKDILGKHKIYILL